MREDSRCPFSDLATYMGRDGGHVDRAEKRHSSTVSASDRVSWGAAENRNMTQPNSMHKRQFIPHINERRQSQAPSVVRKCTDIIMMQEPSRFLLRVASTSCRSHGDPSVGSSLIAISREAETEENVKRQTSLPCILRHLSQYLQSKWQERSASHDDMMEFAYKPQPCHRKGCSVWDLAQRLFNLLLSCTH